MADAVNDQVPRPSLFEPVKFGEIELSNRIVMAPMTRSRADRDDAPTELTVEYYRQRATAGLIIAEGTQPSPTGKGYLRTPGIHSERQVEAWRAVTNAVHEVGGRIVLQLMHVGRIASALNKSADAETVAPSAIRAAGEMFTDAGMVAFDAPRALETAEIPQVVNEFAIAARNARRAGFDGVELHCTSGYLPAQFLSSGSNLRTDHYGGSAENRIRFPLDVLRAMASEIGAGRVGFRICPGHPFNDIHDQDPTETYGLFLSAADRLELAYLHLIDVPNPQVDSFTLAAKCWRGRLILNEGMTRARAEQLLEEGKAEAFSFGRPYIANPDLVERLKRGAPLADFDPGTLYSEGPRGYVDYPAMDSPLE